MDLSIQNSDNFDNLLKFRENPIQNIPSLLLLLSLITLTQNDIKFNVLYLHIPKKVENLINKMNLITLNVNTYIYIRNWEYLVNILFTCLIFSLIISNKVWIFGNS